MLINSGEIITHSSTEASSLCDRKAAPPPPKPPLIALQRHQAHVTEGLAPLPPPPLPTECDSTAAACKTMSFAALPRA